MKSGLSGNFVSRLGVPGLTGWNWGEGGCIVTKNVFCFIIRGRVQKVQKCCNLADPPICTLSWHLLSGFDVT